MSGPRYLLDTNVIIGFLAGVEWSVRFIKLAASQDALLYISAVTRMELLGFSGLTLNEEMRINSFISLVTVVGITSEIEDRAIQIRRTFRLKLPDAIVSATAVCTNATLVSADTDFERVSNLIVLNPSV
jgi:predicted nucleic acid-binding protein